MFRSAVRAVFASFPRSSRAASVLLTSNTAFSVASAAVIGGAALALTPKSLMTASDKPKVDYAAVRKVRRRLPAFSGAFRTFNACIVEYALCALTGGLWNVPKIGIVCSLCR